MEEIILKIVILLAGINVFSIIFSISIDEIINRKIKDNENEELE